jgi:hypothetical protein
MWSNTDMSVLDFDKLTVSPAQAILKPDCVLVTKEASPLRLVELIESLWREHGLGVSRTALSVMCAPAVKVQTGVQARRERARKMFNELQPEFTSDWLSSRSSTSQ